MAQAPEILEAAQDVTVAAEYAGLTYASDHAPGITRRRYGKGFAYVGPDGRPVREHETLRRIKALVIPPAWADVWISPDPSHHLQATGRDERGRKQYRYHNNWRLVRDEAKFGTLAAFGDCLPDIRRRVTGDLAEPNLNRDKVVAAVVALLEMTLIRVGNKEYARDNNSFGLTTMRDRHVEVAGPQIWFEFKGKSGIKRRVGIRDRRLAQVVKRSRDIPGYQLFQYVDESGGRQPVTSTDVNSYLRETTGREFTAKHFRTWHGTVLAAEALWTAGSRETKKDREAEVVRAVDEVALQLGNTRAVCRKCYVHPEIPEAYMDGRLFDDLILKAKDHPPAQLDQSEAGVLALLKA